jgi:2-methylisocitrate lyase-like PEP mutase family enzyme
MESTLGQEEKGWKFAALHDDEPFVFPNPWDAGSAKALATLGFEALATTSAGFAFALGKHDGEVTLDEIADHITVLDEATDLPVAADLENGYGPAPEDAAEAISRAAEAGAVGGSIEDYDRDEHRIYELAHAIERVAAAAEAAEALGFEFTFTARAENHLRNNPDLDDTIARLVAFEEAGADVLYAPGLATVEQIAAVCDAVSKPVNVLALPHLTVGEIFGAGAQRISLGSWFSSVAYSAMAETATAIRDRGDLGALKVEFNGKELLG